jgi:pyruvate formate lyase activating enzyme
MQEGLKYVYVGNVPGKGMENTICPNCHEVIVERRGYNIFKNEISNGKCSHCGHTIKGIWN